MQITIMELWPNFFIVGAMKCGTTSLNEYLKHHPEIFMSEIKEPHYFSKSIEYDSIFLGEHLISEKEEYLHLFENVKDEKIVGEASTTYLPDPEAPKLIHQIVPNARILISVRDPVERALSHYSPLIQSQHKIGTFHEQIQDEFKHLKDNDISKLGLLKCGLYFEGIKRYLDIFEKNHVKIIIFEELVKNTQGILEEILRFLGVTSTIHNFKPQVHNPYRISRGPISKSILWNNILSNLARKFLSESTRKSLSTQILQKKSSKPEMEVKDRNFLIDFYQNDVQKLQDLLGKKLPWPNF